MMVRPLLYAYCVGVPSSRKIERACCESVPLRVITADQQPDNDTIAASPTRVRVHQGATRYRGNAM